MKTTLNIDDRLVRELHEEAARRGTTMSALVEAGLRRILEERVPDRTGPGHSAAAAHPARRCDAR